MKLEAQRKRYHGLLAPLQGALKSKSQIRSDEPEYKAVTRFLDNSQDLVDDYQKAADDFQTRLATFDAVMKREKIYEIDTQTLRKQVADGSAAAEARLVKLRADIKLWRQRVSEEPSAKRKKHEAALVSMERDLDAIDRLVAEVRQLDARFRQEVGDRAKVVIGPQMVTHTVATQFEAKAAAIQKAVDHFNQTAQSGLK